MSSPQINLYFPVSLVPDLVVTVEAVLLLLNEVLVTKDGSSDVSRSFWQDLYLILAIRSFVLNTIMLIISINVNFNHICCHIFPHFLKLRSSEILLPVPFCRQEGLPDLLKHLKPVERCLVFTSDFFPTM